MNYLRRRDLLPVTGFDTVRGGEPEKEGKDMTGGERVWDDQMIEGEKRNMGDEGLRVPEDWKAAETRQTSVKTHRVYLFFMANINSWIYVAIQWGVKKKRWRRERERCGGLKKSEIPITVWNLQLTFETRPTRCAGIVLVVKRSFYRRGLLVNTVQSNLNDSRRHQDVRPVRISLK